MAFIKYLFLIIMPIVAGMVMSGGVAQFLDAPSGFIVIVPTVGTLLVAYRGSFLSSFSAIWKNVDTETLETAIAFWKTVRACAFGYGCIGFMIGLVSMLGSLDDVSSIGPKIAIGLISVMYGLNVSYLLAAPLICLLETKKRSKRK